MLTISEARESGLRESVAGAVGGSVASVPETQSRMYWSSISFPEYEVFDQSSRFFRGKKRNRESTVEQWPLNNFVANQELFIASKYGECIFAMKICLSLA